MVAQTNPPTYPTSRIDKLSRNENLVPSMDKVYDHEHGALKQDDRCASSRPRRERLSRLLKITGFLSLVLLMQRFWPTNFVHRCYHGWQNSAVLGLDDLCPQTEAFTSPEYEVLLGNIDEEYGSSAFRLKAYESLGGAVRIPTESHDDFGLPSEDSRWEIMAELHGYLELRFPKVHANLRRTKVNTYSLVYEWKGTEDVKPLMFLAHMDVVPVDPDTRDHWIQPSYSGYFDGEWIWGRGSCDDKSALIATLIAVETLLEHGFVPSRGILLAFGIDEETGGGRRGAGAISEYLLERYGPDSIAMVVDEGGGFTELNGVVFAKPVVAEKGVMDIRMDVSTPGGHSSTPPDHTAIGILADLITELEGHPHQPKLVRGRTYYQSLECRAKYDTGFPESLTRLLLESQRSDRTLRELGDQLIDFDPQYYALSGTTQAFDLVSGGVKVNALPEVAWAVTNNRIADYSSPAELMSRYTNITLSVAKKHNMTLEAFGEPVGSHGPSWGAISLYIFNNNSLPPSPVTPTRGSGPYELLSGTIRSTLESHLREDDFPRSSIVSPSLMTGNTDTRHYWNFTRHIFRYIHWGTGDIYGGLHTVNEAIRAEGFLEQIRFFTRLILNADRSDLLE